MNLHRRPRFNLNHARFVLTTVLARSANGKRLAPFCKPLLGLLAFVVTAMPAKAALLTTTNCEAAGTSWTSVIWKTNGVGTAVGTPVAGNAYKVLADGTNIYSGTACLNARVRNPTTTGLVTFGGDSLTLTTNTELRLKSGPSAVNFPGVSGNPGLVVDGGFINLADAVTYVVTGSVQVVSFAYLRGANDNSPTPGTTRGLTSRLN